MEGSLLPAPPSPSLRAFLELAFRPLYLAGVTWGLIAIAIWVYAPQLPAGRLAGVAWHAHEMLWGFIATIAVGFLMTAGANWTGINPLKGAPLGIACGLWLIARVGFLARADEAFWIAAAAEIGFFFLAATALMRAVYRARNVRNYAVPWLIVALAAADGLYLLAAQTDNYALLMQGFEAGLLVMALIALLITRRVIPFFAMRGVTNLQLPMQTRTGQVQLAVCVAAVICVLVGQRLPLAIGLGVAGALSLLQLMRWRPIAVRGNPLLWVLYAGHAGLGIGLMVSGAVAAGADLPRALPVHLIAMLGLSVLIIGMVTRTALGHLGRPLTTDRSMLASYVLLLAAGALRLAAIVPSRFSEPALELSAATWIAALAVYLWRFAPMLIRPRE